MTWIFTSYLTCKDSFLPELVSLHRNIVPAAITIIASHLLMNK